MAENKPALLLTLDLLLEVGMHTMQCDEPIDLLLLKKSACISSAIKHAAQWHYKFPSLDRIMKISNSSISLLLGLMKKSFHVMPGRGRHAWQPKCAGEFFFGAGAGFGFQVSERCRTAPGLLVANSPEGYS